MRRTLSLFLGSVTALALLGGPVTGLAKPAPLPLEEAVRLLNEVGETADYPNANAVVAFDRTYVEFDKTGASEQWDHAFVKILTDEGIDECADRSFNYHRQYGSVDIVLARVIKSDGTEVVVGEDLVTDGTPPEIAAMDIYETNYREKTIVFPNLEVGDAIEYLIHETYEPLIENAFSGFYVLQQFDPVVEASVTIKGPSSRPLKHVAKGGQVDFSETTDGGETVYAWRATELPKIELEPGMVPAAQFATRVIVSTSQTWEELSTYAWNLYEDRCAADTSVKKVVADITEGLESTEDKIEAIYYWIIKNVRYLGISMDRGMFLEPHYASYTLEKEYGVCRDKAVLMVAMLKEIGVDAWLVFLNPSRKTDTEVPNIFFEHAIVAIRGEDGEYRYIDPTLDFCREMDCPYIGDRWVLVATEEGEDIRKVPHIPAARNSAEITESSTLSDDGSIVGTVTITGRGMYEGILRTIARSTGNERIRMIAEGMVQGLYPGAELTDFEITDSDDLYTPMTMTLAYRIDGYALDAEPYRLFRVPSASGQFDVLFQTFFHRFTGLEERKYPVGIGVTLGMEERAEVEVPDGYLVENLPDDVDYKQGVIGLSMKYEYLPAQEGRETAIVRYARDMTIDSFQISPEDYLALKEAVRLAERSAKSEVILRRKEG